MANVNVNATAEYRVPFVKGLKLKVQYNRTLDNRLIKKVNFPYEMYNFQTAGTNNHYIDPSNVVVSTKLVMTATMYLKKTSWQKNIN